MKRFFALLALALLLALCAASALADGFASGTTVYVSNPDPTDRLNLRAAPRQDAVSLGKYYNGTPVYVLDAPESGYVHVCISGDSPEGYMDARYLSETYVEPAFPSLTVRNGSGTGVNLRQSPSATAQILATYPNGTRLSVMGVRDDGYLHITHEGYNAYVLASLLTPALSFHKTDDPPASTQTTGPFVQVSLPNLAVVSNPNPLDRLNLRGAPSGDGVVLGKYLNGAIVTLLEDAGNGWFFVSISGKQGYMQGSYLERGGNPVQSAMLSVSVAEATALYETESAKAKQLASLPRGTTITAMGVGANGWCHAVVGGVTGFVLVDKLESDYGLTTIRSTEPSPSSSLHRRKNPPAAKPARLCDGGIFNA
ncbi:MAG: SH3 domain-containing protein [Clostridia bacterium]|nr:SH3 domain-containing protein [Clostridia bacterium]